MDYQTKHNMSFGWATPRMGAGLMVVSPRSEVDLVVYLVA